MVLRDVTRQRKSREKRRKRRRKMRRRKGRRSVITRDKGWRKKKKMNRVNLEKKNRDVRRG